MALINLSPIYLVATCIIAVLIGSLVYDRREFNSHEPPRIYPRVPVIGHQTLKMYPLIGQIIPRLTGCGSDAIKAMEILDDGFSPFMHSMSSILHKMLAPGENLQTIESRVYPRISKALEETADSIGPSWQIMSLSEWPRKVLNGSVLRAFYGDPHPFGSDEDFDREWLAMEQGLDKLLVGFAPKLIAGQGYEAREQLVKRLTPYCAKPPPDDAFEAIKARYDGYVAGGLGDEDIARLELAALLGFVGNTAPSAFWLLTYTHHSPGLLQEIRVELEAQLQEASPGHKPSDPLPMSFLRDLRLKSSLLKSTYDEILRLYVMANSTRQCLEDTWIKDSREGRSYLIKKDTVVLIPNAIMHRDPGAFPEPDQFDPRRFMNQHPAEFRAWGGGETTCTGRFFATSESLATIAMMLLRFDFQCVDDHENPVAWSIPDDVQTSVEIGVFRPTKDIMVHVTLRDGQSLELDMMI